MKSVTAAKPATAPPAMPRPGSLTFSGAELADLAGALGELAATAPPAANRRGFDRKKCELPVVVARLKEPGVVDTISAIATDVSRSGLKLRLTLPLEAREGIAVYLPGPEIKAMFGRVAHCHADGAEFVAGIEFVSRLGAAAPLPPSV